ncbi:MAG: hypothetical protein K6B52_09810 [Clostridiales bacterium]|nr:hypothetical protein [Clostridiales bacterium]
MFCSSCGRELPEGVSVCPVCDAARINAVSNESPKVKKKGKGVISKGSKNFAAMVTALLVFPASFCTAIDLSIHRYDFWFGYIIGLVLCCWVCIVLPVLKVTKPPVTALICFSTIVGYIFYVLFKFDKLAFLYQRALPLFVLFALYIAIDIGLISSKLLSGLFYMSLISFEIGTYIIAIELTKVKSLTALHWSPIIACGFISVAAVFLAFGFINTNSKDE